MDASDERITANRIYLTQLDNRVHEIEVGGRRRLNYEKGPSPLPKTTPINLLSNGTDAPGTVFHFEKITTPINIKWP